MKVPIKIKDDYGPSEFNADINTTYQFTNSFVISSLNL